ncbi:hypothetical protein J2S19_001715 [Metabacillus malikii]|uniref:Uncharacterized protein n=1 Tax=Metabacillus malikii TaxID=1504265 RepID=A0ABT9ZE01_9BACI|nr:hypothetical protein [Metabacillus malikii]
MGEVRREQAFTLRRKKSVGGLQSTYKLEGHRLR